MSEFLRAKVPGYTPPSLDRRVLLHGHCHHKAIAGLEDETALLGAMAADLETLDSGCCGMAGSFGFEARHYDISTKVGELVLLPAVRKAAADTLIVADGFSCREQIEQATGRRSVHLAEALQIALRASQQGSSRRQAMISHGGAAAVSRRRVTGPWWPLSAAVLAAGLLGGAAALAVVLGRRIRTAEKARPAA